MVRLSIIVAIGAVLGVLIYFSPRYFIKEPTPPNHPKLAMGGTSTAFVLVDNRWRTEYLKKKNVELTYESTGTSVGLTNLAEGKYAIAFTHGPLSHDQRSKVHDKGGDVVHIPILLCGVAPVYNVKELKGKAPLKLTGPLLADIFLGNIKTWDDPAIQKVNEGIALPPTRITVVHREDPSGTTLLFTEYLDNASEAWHKEYPKGPASEIQWKVGTGVKRNLGVASEVDRTEGAIGYVDRMFTTYDQIVLDYAAMETNDKKAFVRAETENMTAAAAGVLDQIPEDLTFDLANKPGKDAYPICGVIYAVCYQTQPQEQRQKIVDFLHWATHDGQPHAAKMTYAPLPPELVKRIDKRLETLKAAQ
jgi:phosphate transport system substrate-binding protein